jgi:hypothetical protein
MLAAGLRQAESLDNSFLQLETKLGQLGNWVGYGLQRRRRVDEGPRGLRELWG